MLVARGLAASPFLLRRARTVPVPGKRLVVRHLPPDRLPSRAVATCDGITFDLDLSDDVQRKMYFEAYERRDIRCALKNVPTGSGVCIDVGAYVGVYSLNFARRLGPDGVVHAFEPEPSNFAQLSENCGLNSFGAKVRPHQIALSNRNDQASFFRNHPESGRPYGSLVHLDGPTGTAETVATVRLDSFLSDERIDRVDLLKIDVEAHELEVLEGARSALRAGAFGAILIEFNGVRLAEHGTTLDGFLAAFAEHGYAPTALNTTLLRLMSRRIVPPEGICTNFLFRRPLASPGRQTSSRAHPRL